MQLEEAHFERDPSCISASPPRVWSSNIKFWSEPIQETGQRGVVYRAISGQVMAQDPIRKFGFSHRKLSA